MDSFARFDELITDVDSIRGGISMISTRYTRANDLRGQVSDNVLHYTKPAEEKGVKRKLKDDHLHFEHYLDTLRSFRSYFHRQNLISSTNRTVRSAHTRKLDLTAFYTKRCGCEDIIHTHSHVHHGTVQDPKRLWDVPMLWDVWWQQVSIQRCCW